MTQMLSDDICREVQTRVQVKLFRRVFDLLCVQHSRGKHECLCSFCRHKFFVTAQMSSISEVRGDLIENGHHEYIDAHKTICRKAASRLVYRPQLKKEFEKVL